MTVITNPKWYQCHQYLMMTDAVHNLVGKRVFLRGGGGAALLQPASSEVLQNILNEWNFVNVLYLKGSALALL